MRRAVVLLALGLVSSTAWAGGMFLPVRGARPLGRGGAFTAGVDDAHALFYNPAGLADLDGISLLVDAGLVLERVGYDRIDSGGNPQPHVDGQMNLLPLPTLALTWKPRKVPWLTVAGGVWVPYLGDDGWPEDGPQRYSNISLSGSILLVAELAAAFRVKPWLWLGVGLQNMVMRFQSRVMISACTELTCAPEDPGFDSLTEMTSTAGFVPSGVLGAIIALSRVRIGLNLQLPFFVRSSGRLQSRLPSDPFFARAAVEGDAVDVDLNLPLTLHLGAQWQPVPSLRVELDLGYEAWSMQDRLTVRPRGISLTGVPGIGRYTFSAMHIERGLRDTVSVHLGLEWEALRRRLGGTTLRAGWVFETSATPDETASVLMPDALKNLLCAGVGVQLASVRLDVGYAHAFYADRTVDESRALQLNPVQPSLAVPVGRGRYAIAADVVSAGVEARF